jgi:hypothetical protein
MLVCSVRVACLYIDALRLADSQYEQPSGLCMGTKGSKGKVTPILK